MPTTFCVPVAAREAGVPPRFRYWFGHSGRRYLFTRVEGSALADVTDAVVLVARAGRIVWAGEAAVVPPFGPAVAADPRYETYIHLLAADAAERRAAVRDLSPSCQCAGAAVAA